MNKVTLVAVDIFGKPVGSHNCSDAVSMVSDDQYFGIKQTEGGTGWTLVTPKGSYVLTKNSTQNYWQVTVMGHKIQVSIKKMLANLRYW